MRQFYTLLLGLWLIVPGFAHAQEPQKHVIGCWPHGLFSSFCGVLNQIEWCEQHNKIPVVTWGKGSLYYLKGGFNGHEDVWKYYFEPVSALQYESGDAIHSQYAFTSNHDSSFYYTHLDQGTRDKAARIIDKYVKINSAVQQKIDNFFDINMQGKTIGIHLRGTDKKIEKKPVSPEKIIKAALACADADAQFLLASDEQRLLDQMIALLPGRKVIFYDCYRSDSSKPLHKKPKKPSHAQLGEDVLVEVALLAQCDLLVHTLSNVSTAALYFNPDMPHVVVKKRTQIVC